MGGFLGGSLEVIFAFHNTCSIYNRSLVFAIFNFILVFFLSSFCFGIFLDTVFRKRFLGFLFAHVAFG